MREFYELNKKQAKQIESAKLVENVAACVAVFGEHSLYLHSKASKPWIFQASLRFKSRGQGSSTN